MATGAVVQNILELASAPVMPKTSFVVQIVLSLLLFPSAVTVGDVFRKDMGIIWEKYSSDCAAVGARKIAVHSTLLLLS